MAKDLRSFLDDCLRETPNEVIHITKEVNPANYDVTTIIKHLGAQKKFPIIVFDKPLNLVMVAAHTEHLHLTEEHP